MSIQMETSEPSFGFVKSNLALSLALKKTIVKTKIVKKIIDKDLMKKSLELLKTEELTRKLNESPFGSFQRIDWTWLCDNSEESQTTILSDDSKSVCFNPSSFETNAVRGDKPLKLNAFTYWEVTFKSNSGTSLMLGIGSKDSMLNSIGYLNLIGIDEKSYGLSQHGFTWHGNTSKKFCDAFDKNESITIGCLFDGFKGKLTFYKDGKCLGVGFDSIPLISTRDGYTSFHPMIASTVAQSVFKLEFACENFPTLKDLCRQKIQAYDKQDSNVFRNQLNENFLPKTLLNYLNL